MVLPVVLALAVVLALLLWFLPIQVRVKLHQQRWESRLQVQIKAPMVNMIGNLNISEKIAMALEHMWKRWRAKGEPVKVPLQVTVRRAPIMKIMRTVRRPLSYMGRRIRCRHLEIRAEVGGGDAMESALLAGASWSLIGVGLAQMSRLVRLDPSVPRIVVIPNFRASDLRVQADCILNLRLGHAIVTGVWLLRRVLKEQEIVAWARDSWRRKGEESVGTTPDSGPDADRHGVD